MIDDSGSFPPRRSGLSRLDRRDVLCALAVFLLAVANWIPRLAGPLDLRWDAGAYYVLGTSIYEGKSYRLLNEPGEIQAIQYPPLLPIIVALHQAAVGTSDPFIAGHAMRRSWMVLYAVYIVGVYWIAKKYLHRGLAFGVALITLSNVQSTFLSDLCNAELPFAAMTAVFFLAYRKPGRLPSGIAALAAIAAYLLRTIGIALLAAWVLDAVRQRRIAAAALRAVVAFIPVFAWNAYVRSVEAHPQYQKPAYEYQRAAYLFYNVSYATNMALKDPFRPSDGPATLVDAGQRSLRNLPRLPLSMAEAVTPGAASWQRQLDWTSAWMPWWIPWLAIRGMLTGLGIVTLCGLVRIFRVEPAMAAYISLSLLAIAVAPWPSQYIRYLSPLTPFIAIALVFGLRLIQERMQRRWTLFSRPGIQQFPAAVVCLILLTQSVSMFELFRSDQRTVTQVTRDGNRVSFAAFYYPDTFDSINAAQQWLMKNAARSDVIAASMPHWMYLRTGLKSVMPPFESDPVRAQALLRSVPVRYILLDDMDQASVTRFVAPAIEASTEWRQAFTKDGHCRLFERIDVIPVSPVR